MRRSGLTHLNLVHLCAAQTRAEPPLAYKRLRSSIVNLITLLLQLLLLLFCVLTHPNVSIVTTITITITADEFRSKVACENDVIQLECNPFSRIAIYSASFGRTEYESIQCSQPQGVMEESEYHSSITIQYAKVYTCVHSFFGAGCICLLSCRFLQLSAVQCRIMQNHNETINIVNVSSLSGVVCDRDGNGNVPR